jgi:ChrR Cupin-like domain
MTPRDPKTGKEHLEFFNVDMNAGWVETSPGVEAKTLAGFLDETAGKGHLNRLSRWAPNAELDAVREHDFYEEVLVMKGLFYVASQQNPGVWEEFHAPTFACRPPHAKHGPFKAGPEGCLLFETMYFA